MKKRSPHCDPIEREDHWLLFPGKQSAPCTSASSAYRIHLHGLIFVGRCWPSNSLARDRPVEMRFPVYACQIRTLSLRHCRQDISSFGWLKRVGALTPSSLNENLATPPGPHRLAHGFPGVSQREPLACGATNAGILNQCSNSLRSEREEKRLFCFSRDNSRCRVGRPGQCSMRLAAMDSRFSGKACYVGQ